MKRTYKSKPSPVQTALSRVLILCEGQTETRYFEGLKSHSDFKKGLSAVDVDIYQPDDYSPLGLIREAKARKKDAKASRNPFVSVWVVCDRDQHAGLADAFKAAVDNSINIAFSSWCFEYWILLHFEESSRPYTLCGNIESHLRANHYLGYKKGCNCFEDLYTRLPEAIRRAERIRQNAQADVYAGIKRLHECNPYTNVHHLVKELIKLTSKESS